MVRLGLRLESGRGDVKGVECPGAANCSTFGHRGDKFRG